MKRQSIRHCLYQHCRYNDVAGSLEAVVDDSIVPCLSPMSLVRFDLFVVKFLYQATSRTAAAVDQ